MPEPFKNLFNKTITSGMGEHFAKAWVAAIMLASLAPDD